MRSLLLLLALLTACLAPKAGNDRIPLDSGTTVDTGTSKVGPQDTGSNAMPEESPPIPPKPVKAKTIEPSRPIESQAIDPRPTETKEIEAKPIEAKSIEAKPIEVKPRDGSKPLRVGRTKRPQKRPSKQEPAVPRGFMDVDYEEVRPKK